MDGLDLAEAFVHIADAGSLSKAAERLGTTQATISRKLRKLEHGFKQELVDRTTRSLSLTDAGKMFLIDARKLIDQWQHIQAKYQHQIRPSAKPLNVVVPVGLGQILLTDWVIEYQRNSADVVINLIMQDELANFSESCCDLWIRVSDQDCADLVSRQLASVRQVIVSTPTLVKNKYICGASAVEKLPCVALTANEEIELSSGASFRSHVIHPQAAMLTNNVISMYQAVKQGAGFGVLPLWMVESDLATGTLVEVLPGWEVNSLTVKATFRPRDSRRECIEQFVDHISCKLISAPGMRVFAHTPLAAVV